MPVVALPPATPSTLKVTGLASGTEESCAWKVWLVPTKTAAVLGYTVSVPLVEPLVTLSVVETDGGLVADPVAVTVHVPGEDGAVNKPALLMVPHVAVHATLAVAVNCSVAFTSTVGLVGAMERVVSALPDPERVAVCGLFPAESANTRLAVRVPEADGVKAMVTEQLDEAIKVEPHVLLVIAKSDALAPVIAMLLIVMVDVLALLNVTDFEELVEPIAMFPKVTLVGDTDTPPVLDAVAVPDRVTCSNVPLAETLRTAVRDPDELGLKTTPVAQLPEPARLAPQELLAIAKSPAFEPESPTAPSVIADAPLLLSVTVWPALIFPTLVSGNDSAVGLTVTPRVTGTLPEPESATSCGLPLAESEMVSVAVRDPAAVGMKRMPMLQLLDPGMFDPQALLAIEKSPGFVPAIVTLAREIVVVPSLCNVTDWNVLAEPTLIVPKESDCGMIVNVLILPVATPERETCCDGLNPE